MLNLITLILKPVLLAILLECITFYLPAENILNAKDSGEQFYTRRGNYTELHYFLNDILESRYNIFKIIGYPNDESNEETIWIVGLNPAATGNDDNLMMPKIQIWQEDNTSSSSFTILQEFIYRRDSGSSRHNPYYIDEIDVINLDGSNVFYLIVNSMNEKIISLWGYECENNRFNFIIQDNTIADSIWTLDIESQYDVFVEYKAIYSVNTDWNDYSDDRISVVRYSLDGTMEVISYEISEILTNKEIRIISESRCASDMIKMIISYNLVINTEWIDDLAIIENDGWPVLSNTDGSQYILRLSEYHEYEGWIEL